MAYFIFNNNDVHIEKPLYKIAENLSDLNNLNIIQSDYKILEDTQDNFIAVKFGLKSAKCKNDIITFTNQTFIPFLDKKPLQFEIKNRVDLIKSFLDNNENHPLHNLWSNYYNQLITLNLDAITYPLNKSLEQYFNDLSQPSYSILQLP